MRFRLGNHGLSALVFLLAVAAAFATEKKTQQLPRRIQEEGAGEQGESTVAPEIIGGGIVDGKEYPYFALLYATRDDASSYFCGGTLIKSDVVLTAAHCFDNVFARYVNIGPTLSFVQEEYIEVASITIHPRYTKDSPTRDYDFAIVKLVKDSEATPVSINLDTNFPSLARTPLETIGFGADDSGNPTEILKRVDLDFVPFELCKEIFYPGISPNLHDCADGDPPAAGPCNGDGGGPLLLTGTDILIGVLSFGVECGNPGVDVFAKVADNFHWIATTAGFPPTNAPTPAPTVKPTKDKDSGDSHDPPTHPAPAPTVAVPCHWVWDLGDAFFAWVRKVRNHE